ncbi:hypothetical protein [Mycobacteroides abscessus]|uniref:hypothetical protein n=1 Tax=Mycobacteroides abscessus TaxID=36809 RepID=UPI0009A88FD6|nr:hypothetical protein [Mycobacteroides abscessus]SLJ09380.1 Uncharacterised protein [Mycobacteroides abscessus subsp. abscessus]
MTDEYDDYDDECFELPMDFHEAPDVHDLALAFWRREQIREPKKWWHPMRRVWDVVKYAATMPQRR